MIAGVGNGNMTKAAVDAARSVKKGVVVVRSSRVTTGLVGRNVDPRPGPVEKTHALQALLPPTLARRAVARPAGAAQQRPPRRNRCPEKRRHPLLDDSIPPPRDDVPARRLVKFNEFEGPLGSIGSASGCCSITSFDRTRSARTQVDVEDQWKFAIATGALVRPAQLQAADDVERGRHVRRRPERQMGHAADRIVMVAVPEIWGHLSSAAPRKASHSTR